MIPTCSSAYVGLEVQLCQFQGSAALCTISAVPTTNSAGSSLSNQGLVNQEDTPPHTHTQRSAPRTATRAQVQLVVSSLRRSLKHRPEQGSCSHANTARGRPQRGMSCRHDMETTQMKQPEAPIGVRHSLSWAVTLLGGVQQRLPPLM